MQALKNEFASAVGWDGSSVGAEIISQGTEGHINKHIQYVLGQDHGNRQQRVGCRFKCQHTNSGEEMHLMGSPFSDLSNHLMGSPFSDLSNHF